MIRRERECDIDISRRNFIKQTTLGFALMSGGIVDSFYVSQKRNQVYNTIRRELDEQGADRSYQESLKTVREEAPKHETLDKELLDKHADVFAQARRYDKEIQKRFDERSGEYPSNIRRIGDWTVAGAGLVWAFLAIRRKTTLQEQNKSTLNRDRSTKY